MFALRALLFSISILSIFAVPAPRSSSVIHEKANGPPNGYVPISSAPSGTILTLRINLKSNNLKGLEEALYNASTPGSPSYGKYLSREQVNSFVAPSPETKSTVQNWLNDNDIQSQASSPSGDVLSINVTVSQANQLLDANFTLYKNEATGEHTIRTLAYSLPSSVQPDVNHVYPTVNFPLDVRGSAAVLAFKPEIPRKIEVVGKGFRPKPNKKKSKQNKDKSNKSTTSVSAPPSSATSTTSPDVVATQTNVSLVCNSAGISPSCLQALYGIPSSVGPQNESQIAIFTIENQFAQIADFNLFVQTFRRDVDPGSLTFTIQSLDGGLNIQSPQNASVEANSDIQYSAGVAAGVPTTVFSVGKNHSDLESFLDMAVFLTNLDVPPHTMSSSFLFNEAGSGVAGLQQVCNAYMQLTARGVSIINAAGDGGVISSGFPTCAADGTCPVTNITQFVATFPASCPYVTSVGATQDFAPEVATSLSSGGFSNVFSIPAYQQTAISGFLNQLGDAHAGKFNRTGRGFPDIAAQGAAGSLDFVNAGAVGLTGGSSVSAPIVAGAIGMANAVRMQQGKGPLGFLNPKIYATEGLFTDITSGSNDICGCESFTTTTGWDPVTGLGTPIFDKLVALP